jgi:SAM-dependent methyltransferase
MNPRLLDAFACTACGSSLHEDGGALVCPEGHRFEVRNGIPRFVPSDTYADSFGFQWQRFSRVQIDSHSATAISAQRFREVTGWTPEMLRGALVLDGGCGAGRFAEVVQRSGASVAAVDLSNAVEACAENLGSSDAVVCQASLYELPFRPQSFDFVYSIGVIQHTPDPLRAIRALCRLVKPGGRIALWMYELNWKAFVGTAGFKYALRPLVSRMPRRVQVAACRAAVSVFWPFVLFSRRFGAAGRVAARMLPVAGAALVDLPLSPAQLRDWMLLDTFDMYTPAYDRPQRYSVVARVLAEEGFAEIRRNAAGAIAITGLRS